VTVTNPPPVRRDGDESAVPPAAVTGTNAAARHGAARRGPAPWQGRTPPPGAPRVVERRANFARLKP
jgi:hypothetical protein